MNRRLVNTRPSPSVAAQKAGAKPEAAEGLGSVGGEW
jgi:hypothetical protein